MMEIPIWLVIYFVWVFGFLVYLATKVGSERDV